MDYKFANKGDDAFFQEELQVRIEDYLNDKLQTEADMENIQPLYSSVQEQQALIQKQLEEAKSDLLREERLIQGRNSGIMKRAQAFQRRQKDIDQQILRVTGSTAGDDAYSIYQKSMESLQQLEIAQAYFDLLQRLDSLRNEAKSLIRQSPKAALKPYAKLQTILSDLKRRQDEAEGAAPHLIDHVETLCKELWTQMRSILEKEFQSLLEKMKWPGKNTDFLTFRPEWKENFEKLLEFQLPELQASYQDPAEGATTLPVLLPFEIMARSLEVRFKYHFSGDKPTNRLDKPEYFLSHVFDLLATYDPIFQLHVQPRLGLFFADTDMTTCPQYIDSTAAFITSLLPMIRRKTMTYLPSIADQPQLLSHFIHELISFDSTLRDQWSYTGRKIDEPWKGLTYEILVQSDWFSKWLNVEQEFALSRYQAIIDNPESGEIDFDAVEPEETKPTKGAVMVNDLLESITDRYKPLTSFSQKLRFLIEIQIAILDKFHNRLSSALEAYLAATSSVVRAVQGISKEDQASVQGLAGLERLCRVYGSCEYLEKSMADWSDDLFFLELWEELSSRTKSDSSKRLSGIPDSDMASRAADDSSAAIFDETAAAYRALRTRTEDLLVEMIAGNAREAMRPYARLNHWSTLSTSSPEDKDQSPTTTPELGAPLDIISSYLSYLNTTLSRSSLRRVTRQISLALQTYLWDYIISRNSFSQDGAAQLAADVGTLWHILDTSSGSDSAIGGAQKAMAKLSEAVRLLNLEDGDSEEQLQGVGKELFKNNEAAREKLSALSFEVLNEVDARGILERRVELAA